MKHVQKSLTWFEGAGRGGETERSVVLYRIIVATPELTLLAGRREGPAVSRSRQGESPGLTYLAVYSNPHHPSSHPPAPGYTVSAEPLVRPLSTALSSD